MVDYKSGAVASGTPHLPALAFAGELIRSAFRENERC